MKTKLFALLITVSTCGCLPSSAAIATAAPLAEQTFTLDGARTRASQEYQLETRVVSFAPDGTRGVTDVYRLHLRYAPSSAGAAGGDTVVCLAFTVQLGEAPEVEIPSLKGLTYALDLTSENGKNGSPMLGVPHAPFENLVDPAGHPLPAGNAYHVYNAFVDFHAFCDIFPRPLYAGLGVGALHRLGQKIVHPAAGSEAPVNLGKTVAEGSFFKNGEVTLELKGLGVADGFDCALLGMDSGRSSFAMTMRPMPNLEVKTTGSSHYKADIYLDLATCWVRRVDADEIVVSETKLPMPPDKIDSIIERTISIRNVSAPQQ